MLSAILSVCAGLLVAPAVRRAPAPQASLVAAVDTSLRQRFDPSSISRVLGAWERMAQGSVHESALAPADPMMVQQANSYIEGLEVQLFHEPTQEHAWARNLEQHAADISAELQAVFAAGNLERRGNNVWVGLEDIRDATTVAYGPEWRTLGLQDRGIWDPINTAIFPKTTAALRESGVPCVEAFFAKMPAGSSIEAHSDGCNFHLTCHLGVDVPEGECWLQVGDERREWRNGKLMLFDTSVIHKAANEASVDRYVLMMRVWHPQLKEVEIKALEWIFNCLDDPSLAQADVHAAPQAKVAAPAARAAAAVGETRQQRRARERAAAKAAKKGR